uniref:Uncharacterized protein n=1 Tax=Anopheles melas TaxID=34690 RepID=A0A182U2Y1_9DIPT
MVISPVVWSIVGGGPDPGIRLAAVVGTEMRGDRMIGAPSGFGAVRPAIWLAAARLAAAASDACVSMRWSAADAAAAIFHRSSVYCCGSKLNVLSAGATLVVESRYVPLMMASSISWRFFSSSSPSACGTSSFFTSSSARFSLIVARFSVSSTVISTCRSSDRCSQFGLPRFASSFFLSRIEPFPRTMILQPVSCSSCLAVMPRGPRMRPTKLKSGYSFTGTYTFSLSVTVSPSGSGSWSGSFVTPLMWNREARTFEISSSSSRSMCRNTFGKAANCLRSFSSWAR